MPSVLVGNNKVATEIDSGATAFDVVGDKARTIVVAKVNGTLVDLSYVLKDGDEVIHL